jgi:hypothetical protein
MAKLSERIPSERVGTPQRVIDGVNHVLHVDVTPNTPVNKVNCNINLNTLGENKMTVRALNLTLIDNDTNLKVNDKIVFQKTVVTEHDDDKTIQQVLITGDVALALDEHNTKRSKTVDKSVLRNTGVSVTLEPIEIFELEWSVVRVG